MAIQSHLAELERRHRALEEEINEARLHPSVDDLKIADEAFFTGTAAEVVPIVRIDERTFEGEGALTQRLRTHYHRVVRGEAPTPEPAWVTQVS